MCLFKAENKMPKQAGQNPSASEPSNQAKMLNVTESPSTSAGLKHKNKSKVLIKPKSSAGLKHKNKSKVLIKPKSHKRFILSQQASKKVSLLLVHSFAVYSMLIAMHLHSNTHSLETQNVASANSPVSGLTIAGLSAVKKLLLNRVCAVNNVLVPSYNRRTHSTSHTNSVTYQHRKVSKAFGYVAKKTLRFWIGLALAACYGTSTVTSFAGTGFKPQNLSFALQSQYKSQKGRDLSSKGFLTDHASLNLYQKPTILLVNAIETRAAVLLWRTQMCKSLFHGKQVINHQRFKRTKHDFSLALPNEGFKRKPTLSHSYDHHTSVKNPQRLKHNNVQNQYYPVTRYPNWVYCGSTLRLLHPLTFAFPASSASPCTNKSKT